MINSYYNSSQQFVKSIYSGFFKIPLKLKEKFVKLYKLKMNNTRRSFVDEEDRVIDFFYSLTESEILMSELEANSLDEEKLK